MNSYFEKKTKFNVLVPVTCDWQKKQDVHPQIFFQASFSLPGPAWQMCCSSQRPNPDSKLHFPTCQLLPKGLHDTKRNRTALEPTQLRGTNLSLVISLDNFPWTFETRIHCRLPLQSANIAAVAAEGIVCQCKSGRKTKRYSCHCCNHRPELKRSWCSSHMKRHLKGVEQQDSPANVTKYYACHEISVLRLILVTNETSPSNVTNIAPATKNDIPKNDENVLKTDDASFPLADDSRMIRPWPEHELVISHLPVHWPSLFFALWGCMLYSKLQHFALRLSTQISPNTVLATKSDTATSPILRLPRKVARHHHQILRLS